MVGADLTTRDQEFIKTFTFQQPEKVKQIEQQIEKAVQ
jgi:hypothetical protein